MWTVDKGYHLTGRPDERKSGPDVAKCQEPSGILFQAADLTL